MEIIKYLSELPEENCYIVKGDGGSVIIDPGGNDGHHHRISDLLESNNTKPLAIFLTHGHFDHTGACAYLKEKYNIPLYISAQDECMLEDSDKAALHLLPMDYHPVKADHLYKDGDELEIAGLKFKVMAAPGHTAGSVCLIVEDCMFTGDTVFRGSVGRYDLYSGDGNELKKTLKKLSELKVNYKLYCGHGEETTLDEEKRFNPYFRELSD